MTNDYFFYYYNCPTCGAPNYAANGYCSTACTPPEVLEAEKKEAEKRKIQLEEERKRHEAIEKEKGEINYQHITITKKGIENAFLGIHKWEIKHKYVTLTYCLRIETKEEVNYERVKAPYVYISSRGIWDNGDSIVIHIEIIASGRDMVDLIRNPGKVEKLLTDYDCDGYKFTIV